MVLLNYEFWNLLGGVYKGGGVLYTNDGLKLLSPVRNRVNLFDLERLELRTLSFQNKRNISRMALCPRDILLVSIDQDGYAVVYNLKRNLNLHNMKFKSEVFDVKFSPDGRYLAVLMSKRLEIWNAPSIEKEITPFVKSKDIHITSRGRDINWSSDSRALVLSSNNGNIEYFNLFDGAAQASESITPMVPRIALHGHRRDVISAVFANRNQNIISLAENGSLCIWKTFQDENGGKRSWKIHKKYFFHPSKDQEDSGVTKEILFKESGRKYDATSFDYHDANGYLSVGFRNGSFAIYNFEFTETEDSMNDDENLVKIQLVQALSISQKEIDCCRFNSTGNWIAFTSMVWGQLVIWEWKSETYILKQQGHEHDINCIDISPDGNYIVSGADDGKVKVWDMNSGMCFITFNKHSSPVSDVSFLPSGRGFLSCSLDGKINAFDLIRYRNFRTFATDTGVQYNCIAIHNSGDVFASGGNDGKIYIWEIKSGKLLDTLPGHDGPVSCLQFHPLLDVLYSGSWDKTVRAWNLFSSSAATETLPHESDVLALAVSPDGNEICASTANGQLLFWSFQTETILGTIDGRSDIVKGAYVGQRTNNRKYHADKYFTTWESSHMRREIEVHLCLSREAEGKLHHHFAIIGAESSPMFAHHDAMFIQFSSDQILLKRFKISENILLDGVLDMFNYKNRPEEQLAERGAESIGFSLPGVKAGDHSERKHKHEIQTRSVKFSSTNESWATATPDGILIYSSNVDAVFDPLDVSVEITPELARQSIQDGNYQTALVVSLKLYIHDLVRECLYSIPADDFAVVFSTFPVVYLKRLMQILALELDTSQNLEFLLLLVKNLFVYHGGYMEQRSRDFNVVLLSLRKAIGSRCEDLSKLFFNNSYTLEFLSTSKQ